MLANNFVESLNQKLFNTDNVPILKRLFGGRAVEEKTQITMNLIESCVEIGGELRGEVCLRSGESGVQLDGVYVAVHVQQNTGDQGSPLEGTEVYQVRISEGMFLPPCSSVTLDFKQKLPYSMPLSGEKCKNYVIAGCEDNRGGQRTRLELTVLPNNPLKLLREACQALGFKENSPTGEFVNQCQVIRYVPKKFMSESFSELKLFIGSKEKELNITMEATNKQGGGRKQVKFLIPCASMQNLIQVTENFKRILNEVC
jgi:sporulation-control protein spo0M